jgi:hypothetical protein
MYCKQHDQIMEFRDKQFICAKCDAERGARFRGMFQLMTTGAPGAIQGPRAANDTPSLQEHMGLKMADPRAELTEWRGRAEIAELALRKIADLIEETDEITDAEAFGSEIFEIAMGALASRAVPR